MQIKRQSTGAMLTLIGVAALLGAIGFAVCAEEPATADHPSVSPAADNAEPATAPVPEKATADSLRLASQGLGGGLRAYIDPQTGTLVVPPPKARQQLPSSTLELFNTSHEGLEIVTSPSGYTHVDLRGRFQDATMATIGEDGKVRIHHGLPKPPVPEGAQADTAQSAEKEQP